MAIKEGSPPRMRGKHGIGQSTKRIFRITPAYAGKTLIKVMKEGAVKDHPRVCGENNIKRLANLSKTGSPPRMRGKRSPAAVIQCKCGITPAYAGKTTAHLIHCCHSWDHPRVCGENLRAIGEECLEKGSPPRMRGKRL